MRSASRRARASALRWLGPRRLQVNGLYRHGFLIAPAVLDVVLELLDEFERAVNGIA